MAKSTKSRRREVRRTLKDQPRAGLGSWLRIEVLWFVLLLLGFTILTGLIAVTGQDRPLYRQRQFATETIVARVDFKAVDNDETRKRRQEAYDQEPAVYPCNTEYLQRVRKQLDGLLAYALEDKQIDEIDEERRQKMALTSQTLKALHAYVETYEVDSAEGVKEPRSRANALWKQKTDMFIDGLASIVILAHERAQIESNPETTKAFRIKILHPSQGEKEQMYTTIYNAESGLNTVRNNVESQAKEIFGAYVGTSVTESVMRDELKPTYLFDPEETTRRKKESRDSVEEVDRDYKKNDVLVRAGDRLMPFDLEVIEQERLAYRASLGHAGLWLKRSGGIAPIVIAALALWAYLLAYNPRVITNPMRGLALLGLLLLCQAAAVFPSEVRPEFLYATATFPTVTATIVLAIAYNQRFALAIGVLLSVIVSVSLGMSVPFVIVLWVGAGVAASQLSEVRTRSKLVKVGLAAGVAMAAATLVVSLGERPLDIEGVGRRILVDALLVLAMGLAAGMFTQSVLPVIERVFKVTTSMTLKDLNDPSHTLLRRLGEDAPGTYAHSLRMADMGEAAAEAIGTDGLLCRVGAMFHDVGKINKPMYFVENQGGGPNRHNKLSPAMSLLIIVGHVKDGIEMARESGLPMVLRHFIESHHGTTLVEYFYHAAKLQSQGEGKEAPAEFEFRYPGPKPQTKEAAIIMLCDGVESAVRSLPEPNPARIEQLVHQMAMKRLMDGQFDECNLTLQELSKIEASITKTVCALFHGRIAYPKEDKEEQRSARPEPAPVAS